MPQVPIFEIRDGVVAYATLVLPEGRTWRGARVGMTEAAVRRLYGDQLQTTPSPRGHGHRVTSIMAGLWPFAFELESCS